jgi:hypothetical protein
MDRFVLKDKTLRFLGMDVNKGKARYIKLYFKGDPKNCEFHNQGKNPSFADKLEDCNNHKALINRLYGRPGDSVKKIKKTDKKVFKSISLTKCITDKDPVGAKTHYLNVYELPKGLDFDSRCLVGEFLTKDVSCLTHLRKASKGVLKALTIFNLGKRFYKHGNLIPSNVYLEEKNGHSQIFLDGMLFDPVKYDDKDDKPFKSDFNMLADMLVQMTTASDQFQISEPKNTFDIYKRIKRFYTKNQFPVELITSHLNMPKGFMRSPKCVTLSELEFLLRHTFFNFIFRLKCTSTNKPFRFMDISQALNHPFLTKVTPETWDALPAEF